MFLNMTRHISGKRLYLVIVYNIYVNIAILSTNVEALLSKHYFQILLLEMFVNFCCQLRRYRCCFPSLFCPESYIFENTSIPTRHSSQSWVCIQYYQLRLPSIFSLKLLVLYCYTGKKERKNKGNQIRNVEKSSLMAKSRIF